MSEGGLPELPGGWVWARVGFSLTKGGKLDEHFTAIKHWPQNIFI
jgi:hypothetical protein